MKIIYFGTDNNSKLVLENLVSSGNSVELVVTAPDSIRSRGNKKTPSVIKNYCLQNKINYIEEIPDQELIISLEPDIIIVASYGKIIPESIVNCSIYGTINLHPSLLPKYRGPSPVQTALINNEKITGVSIILLNNEVDGGPIISQVKYQINNEQYHADLINELFKIGAKMINKILDNPRLISKAISQNEKEATYTNKINKSDGYINWNEKGTKIIQLIKALSGNPGTYSILDNKKFKIFKARFLEEKNQFDEPGTLGQNKDGGVYVSVSDGRIIIDEVQIEGKNKISGPDFVRGHQIFFNLKNKKVFKKLS